LINWRLFSRLRVQADRQWLGQAALAEKLRQRVRYGASGMFIFAICIENFV